VKMEERAELVLSVIELAVKMKAAGMPKTPYARMLRESIFFVWETAAIKKHGKERRRSRAAVGMKPADLDYDHAIPMKIVIDMLLEAWPDKRLARQILEQKVIGVLITKDEHKRLREIGLHSSMPRDWDGVDWRARYQYAQIDVDF
jgi:hypothetical protein